MKDELRVLVEDMLGKYYSPENFAEKLKMLEKFYPSCLYKYRALNKYAVENICSSTLWFDSPVNMNDPYDSRHTYSSRMDEPIKDPKEFEISLLKMGVDINKNPYLQELLKGESSLKMLLDTHLSSDLSLLMQKAFLAVHENGLKQQELNYLDKIFICSLSERYDSVLMWTHYTNNHSGFCVEFELDKIEDENHFKSCLYPVIYDENMFDLSEYIDNHDKVNNYSNHYIIQSIIRKSLDWSYENEWRIIHQFGTLKGPQNLSTPKPSSILLGSNFFNSLRLIHNPELKKDQIKLASDLINFCEQQQIRLYLARYSLQKFLMEREFIGYDEANKNLREL